MGTSRNGKELLVDAMSQIGSVANYVAAPAAGVNLGSPTATGTLLPSAVRSAGKGGSMAGIGDQAESVTASSTSISSRSEMLASVSAVSNNDMVNALLLLAVLKMLSGDDKESKDGMAALLALLAMMSQQQRTNMLMYQSSSLSVEQSSVAYSSAGVSIVQMSDAQAAYGAAVPSATASMGGIDISA